MRLSKNENRWIKLKKDDAVILSSRNIPGNERAIGYVLNQLCKLGADVHYEDMRAVHASGHAHQDEQLELLKFIKPRYFIPVHGEYRHLSVHAKTASESNSVKEKCSILENGKIWQYDGRHGQILEEGVVSGRKWVFFDHSDFFEVESIKERRAAARAGVVSVICFVSRTADELVKPPLVSLTGFLGNEEHKKILEQDIQKTAIQAFENYTSQNELHLTREQAVGASARRIFKKAFDMKPLIIVHFIK